MEQSKPLNTLYDGRTDVLYISCRDEAAFSGNEDGFGIVWRYDKLGKLIGATITDAYDRWHDDQDALADRLAERFHVSISQAHVAIDQVFMPRQRPQLQN